MGERKPIVVFLIETNSKVSKVEAVKRSIGYEGCFVVESTGKGGGLVILCGMSKR